MMMANAAAILTDAFPAKQRGMALGINQIAGISGQFIGLLLGGVLAAWDWRLVFWVNVPIGVFGTIWSYRSLREISTTRRARIDWPGNITFALGASAAAGGHHLRHPAVRRARRPGWSNPMGDRRPGRRRGAARAVLRDRDEDRRADVPDEPVQDPGLRRGQRGQPARRDRPRRPAVHAGHLAGRHLAAAARLQLRRHAAVGGHLHAAADRGLPASPGRSPATCPTGSGRGRSPPRACWWPPARSPG